MANVAGYGPECPSLVNDSPYRRRSDAPFSIPARRVWRCVPVLRHRGAISHNGRKRSFGSFERAVVRKARGLDSLRRMFEEYESDVRDARLERGDQDIVGRVALRRRWARWHGWMRSHSDNGDPGLWIPCVGWTEAREDSNGRRNCTECLDWSREMPGSHHHSIPNQRAAHECKQLQRISGIIDAPDHDSPDIRVPVLGINAYLS